MKKGLLLIILILPFNLFSYEEFGEDRDIFYNYMGLIFDGGYNKITHNDWFDSSRESQKLEGNYFASGLILSIFINNVAGDFRIKYIYNKFDDYNIQHLLYNFSGKYIYDLNKTISLTSGIGLYFETGPSNNEYNSGAGFYLPMGILFNIGEKIKITLDLNGRYGDYGLGEDSKKLSYGIETGVLYQVGNL